MAGVPKNLKTLMETKMVRTGLFDIMTKASAGGRAAALMDQTVVKKVKRDAMRVSAHALAAMMKQTIQQQGEPAGSYPPIALTTYYGGRYAKAAGLRRRSNKALIRTSTMWRSISVRESGETWFVGVPRYAVRGRSSGTARYTSSVMIAAVHEFGAVINITVTPKMLRYIHAVLVPAWQKAKTKRGGIRKAAAVRAKRGMLSLRAVPSGGLRVGGTLRVVLPARPFIQPSLDRWLRDVPKFVTESYAIHGFGPGKGRR